MIRTRSASQAREIERLQQSSASCARGSPQTPDHPATLAGFGNPAQGKNPSDTIKINRVSELPPRGAEQGFSVRAERNYSRCPTVSRPEHNGVRRTGRAFSRGADWRCRSAPQSQIAPSSQVDNRLRIRRALSRCGLHPYDAMRVGDPRRADGHGGKVSFEQAGSSSQALVGRNADQHRGAEVLPRPAGRRKSARADGSSR